MKAKIAEENIRVGMESVQRVPADLLAQQRAVLARVGDRLHPRAAGTATVTADAQFIEFRESEVCYKVVRLGPLSAVVQMVGWSDRDTVLAPAVETEIPVVTEPPIVTDFQPEQERVHLARWLADLDHADAHLDQLTRHVVDLDHELASVRALAPSDAKSEFQIAIDHMVTLKQHVFSVSLEAARHLHEFTTGIEAAKAYLTGLLPHLRAALMIEAPPVVLRSHQDKLDLFIESAQKLDGEWDRFERRLTEWARRVEHYKAKVDVVVVAPLQVMREYMLARYHQRVALYRSDLLALQAQAGVAEQPARDAIALVDPKLLTSIPMIDWGASPFEPPTLI